MSLHVSIRWEEWAGPMRSAHGADRLHNPKALQRARQRGVTAGCDR